MFRKMRRSKQQILLEECKGILASSKRAVLSMIGDEGYPYGIPVNYQYDLNENIIYIHGAKVGHKIDAIRQCDKVCFTTWNEGYQDLDDWAYHVTSVIVQGRAELMENGPVVESKLRELAMKYYPTQEEVDEEMKHGLDRVQMIAIHIENMTGKTVYER